MLRLVKFFVELRILLVPNSLCGILFSLLIPSLFSIGLELSSFSESAHSYSLEEKTFVPVKKNQCVYLSDSKEDKRPYYYARIKKALSLLKKVQVERT